MSVSVLITRPVEAVVLILIPFAFALGLAANHANVAVPRAIIATSSIATEEMRALFLVYKRVFIEKFLLNNFLPQNTKGVVFCIPMFYPTSFRSANRTFQRNTLDWIFVSLVPRENGKWKI